MAAQVCVFDAYGTLFDVAAAARAASGEPGRETFAAHWPAIAETWRRKQLEYTWLRALADAHRDFWDVTADALDYALETEGQTDPDLRERLLALYWELEAFPEVPKMLAELKAAGRQTAILSNGSPKMLEAAARSAGIDGDLDAILSVESVGVFKPHRSVYDLVGKHFGIEPGEALFVSSNGWDACAAAAYGFRTVWANRKGEPQDRLHGAPDRQVDDLSAIPDIAAE